MIVYISISNRYCIVTVTHKQSFELVMTNSHMLREIFVIITNAILVCNSTVMMYHGGDKAILYLLESTGSYLIMS